MVQYPLLEIRLHPLLCFALLFIALSEVLTLGLRHRNERHWI